MSYSYVFIGLVFAVVTLKVNACSYLDESSFLVLTKAEQEAHLASCNIDVDIVIATPPEESIDEVSLLKDSSDVMIDQERVDWSVKQDASGTFWDDWAKDLDSPVVSSNLDHSFYGLGVWLPKRYSNINFDDTMELIKKYGLQMSFGFGGEDKYSPRIRFDYRWHEENELDDLFIQVEIPFQ